MDADGGSLWLDYFLGNCTHVVPGCNASLIKYIAFHDYQVGPSSPFGVPGSDVQRDNVLSEAL